MLAVTPNACHGRPFELMYDQCWQWLVYDWGFVCLQYCGELLQFLYCQIVHSRFPNVYLLAFLMGIHTSVCARHRSSVTEVRTPFITPKKTDIFVKRKNLYLFSSTQMTFLFLSSFFSSFFPSCVGRGCDISTSKES